MATQTQRGMIALFHQIIGTGIFFVHIIVIGKHGNNFEWSKNQIPSHLTFHFKIVHAFQRHLLIVSQVASGENDVALYLVKGFIAPLGSLFDDSVTV